jgi:hypothetical protein
MKETSQFTAPLTSFEMATGKREALSTESRETAVRLTRKVLV